MPAPHSGNDALNPQQREAIRLEMQPGITATRIAEAVGVALTTISRWRADPQYVAALDALQREADIEALREARRMRRAASQLIVGAMTRAGQSLAAGDLSPSEAATIGRLGLDVYRSTSAQTGLVEATEHRVTAGPSPADDVSLARRLVDASGYLDAGDTADGG
jgi:hypothetical protein